MSGALVYILFLVPTLKFPKYNSTRSSKQNNNKISGPTREPAAGGGRANAFFLVFVIVYVIVCGYASCLVVQRIRLVASVDVDAALPAAQLSRGFFPKSLAARTSAVLHPDT